MGRAGKDDLHLKATPLAALLQEAADPHMARGKQITIELAAYSASGLPQPVVLRRPEIVHGLRNLIQNAVDFATREARLDAEWTDADILVTISDDGDGFPPGLIGRIGDPYVRQRGGPIERAGGAERPGYEGMGLGLFIAKTLLERTGARLSFSNDFEANLAGASRGAVVTVGWPRSAIEAWDRDSLGENPQLRP